MWLPHSKTLISTLFFSHYNDYLFGGCDHWYVSHAQVNGPTSHIWAVLTGLNGLLKPPQKTKHEVGRGILDGTLENS